MSAISTAIRRLVGGEDDAAAGPVQAIWNGVVIASSERTVVVEGNHGRHMPGREGTHGVFPRCNLACTPCYHARDANSSGSPSARTGSGGLTSCASPGTSTC